MVGDVVIGLLIVALFFAMPAWPYSTKWGYYPIGIIGSALVFMLILSLIGLV
jgi:bacteriorhodopsin